MFTPGAIITFECNEGFFLQGDRRRICGLDGRWDIPEHGYTECLREFIFMKYLLLPKFIIPFQYLKMNIYFVSHAYNDCYLLSWKKLLAQIQRPIYFYIFKIQKQNPLNNNL